jgi:hypothetical protein
MEPGPLVSRSGHLNSSRGSQIVHAWHRIRWHGGDHTPTVAIVPRWPVVLIPRVGIARGTQLHFVSPHDNVAVFTSAQPPSLCLPWPATAERSHHRPSWGKGSPSSPLLLAPSWSSSHRSSTPGERVHHTAFFFRVGLCRPSHFNLFWANRPYHELPLHPLLLTDPRFHSGSLSSAPPTTASPSPSSSPLVGRLGEPLYVKPVPIESLGARLAPRHHLAWPLTTGWSEPAGETAPAKGGIPCFLRPQAERPSGAGPSPNRLGWATVEAARLHSAIYYFSIRFIQINSIQFKFKSGLKFGNS